MQNKILCASMRTKRKRGDKIDEKKRKKSAYDVQYQKENCYRFTLSVNRNKNKDIVDHLKTIRNKSRYLINLIKKDMKKD